MTTIDLSIIHPSWRPAVAAGIEKLQPDFLQALNATDWLPGPDRALAAFQRPLEEVNYVLFGESPYPRAESANGYAFWDAAVDALWSETGLSKPVNRATSLRNWIKALLVADGRLDSNDTGKEALATVDKQDLVQTAQGLFSNMLDEGFLLLNASLSLAPGITVSQQAKHWTPLLEEVLNHLAHFRPEVKLVLFGKIAERIQTIPAAGALAQLCVEHPYNISFINNPAVHEFFGPMELLGQR